MGYLTQPVSEANSLTKKKAPDAVYCVRCFFVQENAYVTRDVQQVSQADAKNCAVP